MDSPGSIVNPADEIVTVYENTRITAWDKSSPIGTMAAAVWRLLPT